MNMLNMLYARAEWICKRACFYMDVYMSAIAHAGVHQLHARVQHIQHIRESAGRAAQRVRSLTALALLGAALRAANFRCGVLAHTKRMSDKCNLGR